MEIYHSTEEGINTNCISNILHCYRFKSQENRDFQLMYMIMYTIQSIDQGLKLDHNNNGRHGEFIQVKEEDEQHQCRRHC